MFYCSYPKAVDSRLIRGGRPINTAAIQKLKKMEVETVICLLQDGKRYPDQITGASAEKWAIEEAGLKFVHISMNEARAPSFSDISKFLEIVSKSKGKVYVHCSRGLDRAGLLVAIYEIEHGKTYEEAYSAYLRAGHDFLSWPNLDLFLYEYATSKLGNHLDPAFAIASSVVDKRARKMIYDYIMK